jgi:hypothetical protein
MEMMVECVLYIGLLLDLLILMLIVQSQLLPLTKYFVDQIFLRQ